MAREYGNNQPNKKMTEWEKLVESNAKTPTVYFFYSDNCSFCSAAKPYIDDLEKKYAGRGVEVFSINVDKHPELARDAQVNSWPHYKFAMNGMVIGEDEGWQDSQRWVLEDRLQLTRKFQTHPGLLLTDQEFEVLRLPKEDWYPEKTAAANRSDDEPRESNRPSSGACGDSAYQTAELAEGIQEMFADLERKLEVMNRATQTHIDGVRTVVDSRLDDYERIFGGKKCDCGKK